MKKISYPLVLSDQETLFLQSLQESFSAACNLTSNIACKNHCTARVALHHLAYQTLRKNFPQLGAQMACNAIYTVARTFKQVGLQRSNTSLPKLIFAPTAPVFFDQRTLTLKGHQISLFTLDGRLHFNLNFSEENAQLLESSILKEVVLTRKEDQYYLHFFLNSKSPHMPAKVVNDTLKKYVFIDSAQAL